MKRILISTAAIMLGASAAYAADPIIYEPAPAPLPVAAMFNWSGLYAGINAGYGGGTIEHPFGIFPPVEAEDDPLTGSLDVTAGGGLVGAQIGYNWQMNQFVFGAETDIQWSGIKGEVSGFISNPDDIIIPLEGSAAAGTEINWFGTIRGRLGYTMTDRFMVFATGGAAYGNVNSYVNIGDETFEADDTNWGWTIGAGAEYAFTDSMSLKTEYLFTDLGDQTILAGEFGEGGTGSLSSDVKFHTVRVGLNFHF